MRRPSVSSRWEFKELRHRLCEVHRSSAARLARQHRRPWYYKLNGDNELFGEFMETKDHVVATYSPAPYTKTMSIRQRPLLSG